MNKGHLSFGLAIVLMILGACNLRSGENLTQFPTDQPVIQTPAISTEASAVSVFGPGTFTFKMPPGWNVFGPEKINTDPTRPFDLYLLGEDPVSNDGPGVSKIIIASAAEWTAEELTLTQCSTCPQNAFETVTLAGKTALRTQIGGGGVPFMITWYFVENQGNLIGFALHDPQTLEPLNQVIETIQFD